jgi:hypothetical protein
MPEVACIGKFAVDFARKNKVDVSSVSKSKGAKQGLFLCCAGPQTCLAVGQLKEKWLFKAE